MRDTNLFENLLTDQVILIKQDGRRFEGVCALVRAGTIITADPTIPIEDGDDFERVLPSGVVERFSITDAGYMECVDGIPPHYQSRVRKESAR